MRMPPQVKRLHKNRVLKLPGHFFGIGIKLSTILLVSFSPGAGLSGPGEVVGLLAKALVIGFRSTIARDLKPAKVLDWVP